MPWIRIDDHFDEHPKLAAAGPLAWALWMAGLAYCNRNLTDGFVPWSKAPTLVHWDFLDATGPTRIYVGQENSVHEEGAVTSEYVIELLIEAGLWDRVARGYQVHDFDQYQPTKAVVLAERAKKVAAGQAGGQASAAARATARGRRRRKPMPSTGSTEPQAEVKPVPVPVPGPARLPETLVGTDGRPRSIGLVEPTGTEGR